MRPAIPGFLAAAVVCAAAVSCGPPPPVAPSLSAFTASPSSVASGIATTVTWTFSFDNAPRPEAQCAIDHDVGAVTDGAQATVTLTATTTFTLRCSNSAGESTQTATLTVVPPVAPQIASFTASPSSVVIGIPTTITWDWSYASPPLPEALCRIDNGVGVVTPGSTTTVTLSADTQYTLSCDNQAGGSTKQVTVTAMVQQVAPSITGFAASPSALTAGAATNVTWTWSYAATPLPTPACSIEHGVGTVTSGSSSSVTLSQARTYQLQCTSTAGTSTAEVTLSVNDCGTGATCGAHAHCIDTVDSYTCACDTGYTGDGDTCSALASCDVTPSLCDPNATCTSTGGAFACVCRPGYAGDGTTCARERITFVTSTSGNGNLSTWADAGGQTGLAAGDAICRARAAAAGLPGTYVAWLSSTTSDAYCRVNGFTGKKANLCGQAALPVSAGPWVGVTGTPFAPAVDRLLAPRQEFYYPDGRDERGAALPLNTQIYTATDVDGTFTPVSTQYPLPCNDWTYSVSPVQAMSGLAYGGGTAWTHNSSGFGHLLCDAVAHLRCMEIGAGPALPPRHPAAKRAFLTSVSGNGDLSTWPGSGGVPGLAGADAVCRQRARYAGFPNAQAFKAWLSGVPISVSSRFTSNGPWARIDGVFVAMNKADLFDGQLLAPIPLTELGQYATGATLGDNAWTGSTVTGGTDMYSDCMSWTSASSTLLAQDGLYDFLDSFWAYGSLTRCSTSRPLYCFED